MKYFKSARIPLKVALFCLIFAGTSHVQALGQCPIDSLIGLNQKEILATSVEKSLDVIDCVTTSEVSQFYSLVGDLYQSYNTDSSVVAYQLARENALVNNDQEQLVISNYKLGRLFLLLDDFSNSITFYKENIAIIDNLSERQAWTDIYELRSNGNLGVIYSDLGDYNKSLMYFIKVLEMSEKSQNQAALSYTLNNIGSLFIRKEEPEKAIPYLQRSLDIKKNDATSDQWAETYLNIGAAYYEMAKYRLARTYFDSSFMYVENPNQEVNVLMNIASVFEETQYFDSALYYQKLALSKAEQIEDLHNMAISNGNIANIYHKTKAFKKGIPYVNRSIELSRQLGVSASVSSFTRLKSLLLYETGRHQEAFNLLDHHVVLNDSIMGVQKAQEFDKLLIVYETEKKEQEIANLTNLNVVKDLTIRQQRSQWIVFISIATIVLLIILVLFLIVNAKRLKVGRENEIHKQKLLRTQMNPHFIANTLNAIQNYVLANQATDAASYLAKFSKLMREILESSDMEQISLEREILLIRNYLELQKIRFESRFDYEINVSEEVDPFSIEIPPMITQPFIENCIEHGFKDIDYKGLISVNFMLSDQKLILEVSDNGVGIRQTINSSSHRSMATRITKERIERARKPIDFLIENLKEPHTGTLVRLEFQL